MVKTYQNQQQALHVRKTRSQPKGRWSILSHCAAHVLWETSASCGWTALAQAPVTSQSSLLDEPQVTAWFIYPLSSLTHQSNISYIHQPQ